MLQTVAGVAFCPIDIVKQRVQTQGVMRPGSRISPLAAVHEVWASRADYEAYAASPAGQAFRKQINAYKGAPFDDIFFTEPAAAKPRKIKTAAKK